MRSNRTFLCKKNMCDLGKMCDFGTFFYESFLAMFFYILEFYSGFIEKKWQTIKKSLKLTQKVFLDYASMNKLIKKCEFQPWERYEKTFPRLFLEKILPKN